MKSNFQGAHERRRGAADPWIPGVCALVVVMAAGCASKASQLSADAPQAVKEAAVRERASARWAELIKGDKDAAYAFLSPGARQMMSAEQFNARVKTGGFRGVQIDKVDCEAEICKVSLQLTYDYLPGKGSGSAKGITTAVQETWVVEQGQAWFVMRP